MTSIDNRVVRAGTNEIYRWGRKAHEKVMSHMEEHNGYYSIPVRGGKYWSFGTSFGKYGEFMKYENCFFSVNRGGYAYAKVGTEKGDKFLEMLNKMLAYMDSLYNTDEEEEEND